jgi:hypothetical protein
LKDLNPEEVESDHKSMLKDANRLARDFETAKIPKAQTVASTMAKKLTDFKPYIPVIRSLCNQGLQPRHIE